MSKQQKVGIALMVVPVLTLLLWGLVALGVEAMLQIFACLLAFPMLLIGFLLWIDDF